MIKKTKWVFKEAKLRLSYMTSRGCIFCKVIAGEMGTKFLVVGKNVVAFADINPVAETHVLIVPKKHIGSVAEIKKGDGEVLEEMFTIGAKLARDGNLESYRLAFNAGNYQHVPHLHMHLLAGKKVNWSKL